MPAQLAFALSLLSWPTLPQSSPNPLTSSLISLSTLIWRERCCGKSIGDSYQSCSLRITSTSLTRLFFPAHQCSGSRLILCVVCHLFCGAITNEKSHQHLVGQQYSWVSSVFYFGYLSWAYPTTYLIQRLPVGKYVSINTIIWGTLVALTAACKNFGGLVTVRFSLGCGGGDDHTCVYIHHLHVVYAR